MLEQYIEIIKPYIIKLFENDSTGHDISHLVRTMNTALYIQEKEGGDRLIIGIAAFLHDVHRILENEINKAILSNIDKMLTKVNNVNELAKKLFAQFCNDDKVQKHLTDLTYSSDEFADLSYEDFTQALKEVFDRLKNLKIMLDKNEIRAKYKNNNTTEEEQIRISKEIYEKFGHRR